MTVEVMKLNSKARSTKGVRKAFLETYQAPVYASGEVQQGEIVFCLGEGICEEGKAYFRYALANPTKAGVVVRFFNARESINEIRAALLRAYADAIAAKTA
jgi:hypothetical protein